MVETFGKEATQNFCLLNAFKYIWRAGEKNGIEDKYAHFKSYIDAYNKTAVPYKKVGLLRVRAEEFPKNTLRKILRLKIDMTID